MQNMNTELVYEPANEDHQEAWSTYDIAIASTALSLGHHLQDIDREQHPSKALFVFQRTEKLDELVDAFYADRLSTNPRELFDAHKLLKNRIYASR